jgi:hypothetical protein
LAEAALGELTLLWELEVHWVKHFIGWLMVLVIFDGVACVGLRAALDPSPALTIQADAGVPCEVRTNRPDSNVTGATSSEQSQLLGNQGCATPAVLQADAEAQRADVLYARGHCPALDSVVHRAMSIDELKDLKDQLCPRPTPTPTVCEQAVAPRVEPPNGAESRATVEALCRNPLEQVMSDPQRTGN